MSATTGAMIGNRICVNPSLVALPREGSSGVELVSATGDVIFTVGYGWNALRCTEPAVPQVAAILWPLPCADKEGNTAP